MIQPPKLAHLAATFLSDASSSIEEWLQHSKQTQAHRLATPSPAPPIGSRSNQDHDFEVSSTSDQEVPNGHYDDGHFHDAHRDRTRHPDSTRTTPVPACEELFFADFDLPSFDPSEIWVTLDDDALVVEGEHRQLYANHYECHEYFRKVPLPADIDTQAIKCTLHRDGHLLIEAPLLHAISEYTDEMETQEAVDNIPED